MAKRSTCSDYVLTNCAPCRSNCPTAGKPARRTTNVWRDSLRPSNISLKLAVITTPKASARREAILAAYEVFQQHERELVEQLMSGLRGIAGITIYGITDAGRFEERTATVAIRMEGYTPGELARYLGERGIFTWHGNYYAIDLAERLGVQESGGMLRIGLTHYNTAEEVERLLAALRALSQGVAAVCTDVRRISASFSVKSVNDVCSALW